MRTHRCSVLSILQRSPFYFSVREITFLSSFQNDSCCREHSVQEKMTQPHHSFLLPPLRFEWQSSVGCFLWKRKIKPKRVHARTCVTLLTPPTSTLVMDQSWSLRLHQVHRHRLAVVHTTHIKVPSKCSFKSCASTRMWVWWKIQGKHLNHVLSGANTSIMQDGNYNNTFLPGILLMVRHFTLFWITLMISFNFLFMRVDLFVPICDCIYRCRRVCPVCSPSVFPWG